MSFTYRPNYGHWKPICVEGPPLQLTQAESPILLHPKPVAVARGGKARVRGGTRGGGRGGTRGASRGREIMKARGAGPPTDTLRDISNILPGSVRPYSHMQTDMPSSSDFDNQILVRSTEIDSTHSTPEATETEPTPILISYEDMADSEVPDQMPLDTDGTPATSPMCKL